MVKIRLARSGAKKRPFYHIVVTDRRNRRDGSYIERLGYFNPVATGQEMRLQVDAARVDHWVKIGAQVSDRVKALVKEAATEGEEGAVKARARPVSPTTSAKRAEAREETPVAEAAPAAEEAKAADEPKAEPAAAEAKAATDDEAKAEPADEPKAEPADEPEAEPAAEQKAGEGAASDEAGADSAPAEGEGSEEDEEKQ